MTTLLDTLTVPLTDLIHSTDTVLDEAIRKAAAAAEEESEAFVSAFNSAI